jgi:hypothetical protein
MKKIRGKSVGGRFRPAAFVMAANSKRSHSALAG